jgi:arylsulfatase A-like enzyme
LKLLKLILVTVCVLICFFYLAASCVRKKPGPEFIRLIDHLGEKDILSSPLLDLESQFDRVKQEWSGQDFVSLNLRRRKCWAVSTRYPLLASNETRKPEKMAVSREGQELAFSQNAMSQAWSWRFIKGQLDLLPRKIHPKKRRGEGIVLGRNEFLETDIILPQSKVAIDIFAGSENADGGGLRMSVFLDDQKIATLAVRGYRAYRILAETRLGAHRLRLSLGGSALDQEGKSDELYVDLIQVKAQKDILLICPPAGEEGRPEGMFAATFYREPVDRFIAPGPSGEIEHTFPMETVFASTGKKQIEIIGQPKRVPASLSLWVGDRKIATKRIDNLEWESHCFEAIIPEGQHSLRVDTEMALHGIVVENPRKNALLPIHKVRKGAELLDQGIGENPYVLKKKFVITQNAYGRSFNTVFAPPHSVFEFELNVPADPMLEFGFGLLDQAWREPGDGVNFIITIENERGQKVIFSKHLNPYQNAKQRRIFQNKIDLSDYQGQRVKLSFVTEGFPPRDKSMQRYPDQRNDLSYWFNPVVYERSRDGLNIILISIDTLRADHLGCYDYNRETSPNIDLLAQDGVLFRNTFSDSPWTLPAHVSLFTALFTISHGVNSLNNVIPPSFVTLADVLRQHGYACSAFTGGGKVSAKFGFSKGFDFYGESKVVFYQENAVEQLFKKTSRWIDRNKDKPFFLFLHTYQVHGPYSPPAPYDQFFSSQKIADKERFLKTVLGRAGDKYRPIKDEDREAIVSLYDGEIRYTDEFLIKPLLDQLRDSGLYDRTMIIFTSDHGEEFFDHNGWEHSHSLYNELIRVPLIIKFPDSEHKGTRVDDIVRLVDIAPSILEVIGLKTSLLGSDGQSLLTIIKGKEKGDRVFVSYLGPEGFRHTPEKITMNDGRHKLILNGRYTERALSFFKPPPPSLERLELYHLGQDPLEQNNLFSQRRAITQELLKELEKRLEQSHQARLQDMSVVDDELEERLRALGYIK